jgi:hypothetical protein
LIDIDRHDDVECDHVAIDRNFPSFEFGCTRVFRIPRTNGCFQIDDVYDYDRQYVHFLKLIVEQMWVSIPGWRILQYWLDPEKSSDLTCVSTSTSLRLQLAVSG